MKIYDLYINLYYALDFKYDENPTVELGNFLSGMNPFLFKGEGSAIDYFYQDFKSLFIKKYNNLQYNISLEKGFEFCKEYLENEEFYLGIQLLEEIGLKEWVNVLENN